LEIRTDNEHSRTGGNGSIASQKEKWKILNAMLHIPPRENVHIRRREKMDGSNKTIRLSCMQNLLKNKHFVLSEASQLP
jgi:hypothetical protein